MTIAEQMRLDGEIRDALDLAVAYLEQQLRERGLDDVEWCVAVKREIAGKELYWIRGGADPQALGEYLLEAVEEGRVLPRPEPC